MAREIQVSPCRDMKKGKRQLRFKGQMDLANLGKQDCHEALVSCNFGKNEKLL